MVLSLLWGMYGEAISALPFNGGTYNVLINTSSKVGEGRLPMAPQADARLPDANVSRWPERVSRADVTRKPATAAIRQAKIGTRPHHRCFVCVCVCVCMCASLVTHMTSSRPPWLAR
jgi:hypothetical protein